MIGCVLATTMLPPQPATAGRHTADSTVPTVRIHPGSLPRGVPTSHPRLAGTTIRDAGLRREVPRLARYPLVWMYGPAAHGYLLGAVRRDDAEVELWYVPRGGRAERLRTGDFTLSRIAPSGRIAAFHDRHGRERVQLRTIPGNEPIATYAAARRRTWVDVLDVRRRRALVAVGERLVGWLTPRSEPLRPVARVSGWWASARHNLLLVDAPHPAAKGGFAMVRIDRPRTVLWRSGMGGAAPQSISPDGRYLVTMMLRPQRLKPYRLDIRRTRDGKLVRRFRAHELDWRPAWVGPHRFLLPVEGSELTAVVRCGAVGDCVRVGRTVPTRPGTSPAELLDISFAPGT